VADAHLRGLGDAGAAQHQVRVARGLEAHRGHRHGVAAADGQERPDPGQHGAVAARVEGEVGALGHVHQMGRGRLPQGCEGRAEARAAVVAVEVAVEVIVVGLGGEVVPDLGRGTRDLGDGARGRLGGEARGLGGERQGQQRQELRGAQQKGPHGLNPGVCETRGGAQV
ncbi:hypothetical protein EG865_15305, partial [Enterococcus faecalis]